MNSNIFEILSKVEQPSRYLGTEVNSVLKDYNKTELSMALVFPDSYEIGISHFGLQILYDILNNRDDITAERVYAPEPDLMDQLKENNLEVFALESKRAVKDFDIVGFSLLYELNYTNILYILENSGIPFLSKDRDDSFPIIIAGGPCAFNPEPVADFFDAIIIGDGEKAIIDISDKYIEWKKEGKSKKDLLKEWSEIDGVYIPSFFEVSYDDNNLQILKPVYEEYKSVKKAIVPELDFKPFPEKPIVPYSRPVHDRLRLEIARGCSRGCRFCQAGMIYRPVRERSLKNILEITEKSIKKTGFEDISLLSLSTGDYGCLHQLMQGLMEQYKDDKISVSLPSIRAGKLTPELMELIKKVRKTGFTIAPEAGTQRLRDVINKGIDEDEIVKTVESAFSLGWKVIKLYFMVGLPTETKEDLEGIVALVKKLVKLKPSHGKKSQINVSVSTFIPKSHSPFQWFGQNSLEVSKDKIFWLKDNLNIKGVNFKWGKPDVSMLEGIFARGDRKLSELLISAYSKGCIFDGWTDRFNKQKWDEAILECGIDTGFYITRDRDINEKLPWDHIKSGVDKSFFVDEYKKAEEGSLTEDCRDGECSSCGICDFDLIEPKVFNDSDPYEYEKKSVYEGDYKNIKITYSKRGSGKFFGHLEMVNIFQRALKRVSVPVKFTQGFHPKPKMSFGNPLPISVESNFEYFKISVPQSFDYGSIKDELNSSLPEGLLIVGTEIFDKIHEKRLYSATYEVTPKETGLFDIEKLENYKITDKYIVFKTNKKGVSKEIDIKDRVISAKLDGLKLILEIKTESGKSIRPHLFMKEIFLMDENVINSSTIVKTDIKYI
ncbi:MAG: TIGR03960 family B12-binding radical SAM protein [Deltaproteobacteria bacterium]|nr:TIGR03960 family B12-binding radical SAM protein [Deltaproteobacteria bacterium]